MASSSKSNTPHVDEDVDDLDDVLEQFSFPTPKPAAPAELPQTSKTPALSSSSEETHVPSTEDAFTDGFAAEFAKGMESLLKGLEDGTLGETSGPTAEDKKFKEAWSKIMGDTEPSASTSTSTAPGSAAKSSQKGPEGSFQDRIKQTMDKIKEGGSSLEPDGDGDEAINPDLVSLLSSLNNIGDDKEAGEELEGIVEFIMSQLVSKQVLYEPLKEIHEKFPGYLAENESKLSPEDKDRYAKQQRTISKIIAVFEAKDYSEEDPEMGLKMISLMNEMQEHGAPPAQIMGELPPGVALGADGLPQLPGECCIM